MPVIAQKEKTERSRPVVQYVDTCLILHIHLMHVCMLYFFVVSVFSNSPSTHTTNPPPNTQWNADNSLPRKPNATSSLRWPPPSHLPFKPRTQLPKSCPLTAFLTSLEEEEDVAKQRGERENQGRAHDVVVINASQTPALGHHPPPHPVALYKHPRA